MMISCSHIVFELQHCDVEALQSVHIYFKLTKDACKLNELKQYLIELKTC